MSRVRGQFARIQSHSPAFRGLRDATRHNISNNMTEAEVNGAATGEFDFKSIKAALESSSTVKRTGQWRTIDEKLSQNGELATAESVPT